MLNYLAMLEKVITSGRIKSDRTNTGTISIFGHQLRFDLQEGFPLVTTKRVHMKSVIHELLWFLKGETNIKYLQDNGVKIWDEWADENGELGPIYGYQWRHWGEDQIKELEHNLLYNPFSRRHLVSAWNVEDLRLMALAPCHSFFQMDVTERDGLPHLSCQVYLRSWDVFLGGPFNIASYALLTHMLARVLGYVVGDLVVTSGDTHLYSNHILQAQTQLKREPRPLPVLTIRRKPASILDFEYDDFELIGYDPHDPIKAKVAV